MGSRTFQAPVHTLPQLVSRISEGSRCPQNHRESWWNRSRLKAKNAQKMVFQSKKPDLIVQHLPFSAILLLPPKSYPHFPNRHQCTERMNQTIQMFRHG